MIKKLPIVVRTTVFVTLVCLSLVAVDAWHSWNARSQHLRDVQQSAGNLARAMAQHADDAFEAADNSLSDLIERIALDGLGPAATLRLHRVMVRQVAERDQLSGLFVYDADGRWLVNSLPLAPPPAVPPNNADRAYFVYHRDHAQPAPHIGAPVRSRSTGQWVIPVSRRLNHADGSFAGVALATIDIEYFKNYYDTFDIGQRGAVALLTVDGTMLMRRPFSDAAIGASIAGAPLYQAFRASGKGGSGFFHSRQDGEVRLNSYWPLQHYPLFVTAGLSKREIFAQWQRNTLVHLGGVLVLCLLMALFGWRLIKQIALRAHVEARLRAASDALAAANATLEQQAMQDGLTGLANRRQLDIALANEFSRARRGATPLAFVMLDVDHFKQYNDRYGHMAGDECLRALAKTIQRLTPKRAGDLAARYGGEELALLLPGADAAGALVVAEQIRVAIAALQIEHAGSSFGIVTVSAGVAAMQPRRDASLAAALVEAADKALYQAKEGGRNQVAQAPAAG